VKFVFASDWHHDWVTCGVPRKDDVEKAVVQSVSAAVEMEADGYFFTGDLCDPDDGPSVIRAVRFAMEAAAELARHAVPSFWLAGNHDVVEDGSGETTLSPLKVLGDPERCAKPIYVLDRPRLMLAMGVPERRFNVLALPFTATSHRYDPVATVGTFPPHGMSQPLIVVGHLTIPGVQPGEETTEMPRGRDVVFPFAEVARAKPAFVVNGHYHRRQTFEAPNGLRIHIPGSLARLTFAEEKNEPAFLVAEL
jgi:DNA repair exonuclease SbcCD nuclease subunit